ncbi:transglycosylase domain-containing protein, partial [Bacillus sp. SS-TM]
YISHDEYVQAVSEKLVIRHDIKIEQRMKNN